MPPKLFHFADGVDENLPSSPAPAAAAEPDTAYGGDRRHTQRRSGADRRRGRPPLSDHPAQVSMRLPTELLEELHGRTAARRDRQMPNESHLSADSPPARGRNRRGKAALLYPEILAPIEPVEWPSAAMRRPARRIVRRLEVHSPFNHRSSGGIVSDVQRRRRLEAARDAHRGGNTMKTVPDVRLDGVATGYQLSGGFGLIKSGGRTRDLLFHDRQVIPSGNLQDDRRFAYEIQDRSCQPQPVRVRRTV